MRYSIDMYSDVYGLDSFDYSSLEELQEGLLRLAHDVVVQEKLDGIQRWLSVHIVPEDSSDEE